MDGGDVTIAGRLIGATLLLASLSAAVVAQQYPSGPITIVLGFAPAGTTDILARMAAEVLQAEFKQSAVVENRTGGGGIIANTYVARAQPDGQTLLLAPTAFAIAPHTIKNLPYDPVRDLKPITLLGYTANVMVVSPQLPVNSVKEFIDYAKSGDRYITYASPGLGTPTQIGAEGFAHQTGIKMTHVPYRGAMPAVTGLMSGEVTMMFLDLAPAMPLIEAGKLKALGMLTMERHPSLPNLPTVAETVPGFYLMGWQGLFAPGRTPDAIVDRINAPLVRYLKTPEAKERLDKLGVDIKSTTPAEMREWVASQIKHWGNFANSAGIVPQ
jgi:tripartite-type tricarboxylate transporter receptor subunit TctC